MDIILTDEQRKRVVSLLEQMLSIFSKTDVITGERVSDKPSTSQRDVEDLIWKSFEEWKAEGCFVKKGERGTKINGITKFSENQVKGSSFAKRQSGVDNMDDCNGFDDDEEDVPF